MELKIVTTRQLDKSGYEYLDEDEIEVIMKSGDNCIFLWIDGNINPIILKREHVEMMLVLMGNK